MKEIVDIVFLVTILFARASGDPCNTALSIGDTKRTTTEDPGTCGGLCDTQIVEGNWYRLDYSNSGASMPESCAPVWSCGTYIPIWLNAAHPTEDNPGPITATVCAQLSLNGPCCEWTDQIQVKWCSSGSNYFVYRLKKPPFCDMAYCAGTGINCGTQSSWNDIIKNCSSSPYPSWNAGLAVTLGQPYISDTKSIRDRNGNSFTATKFSMKCTLTYTRQTNDTGARYDVAFLANGDVVYKTTLKSTDIPEVVMSEKYLNGRVNQQVVCRATSYWQSGYPIRSPFVQSSAYLLAFQILNAKTTAPLGFQTFVQEGDKLSLTVGASFPITTPGCYDGSVTECDPYYNFNVYSSGMLYLSKCSIQVSSDTISQISLSPIANTDNYLRAGSFNIVPVNTAQTQTSIFNNYRSSAYQIAITERNWLTCTSWGDPHLVTFYGPKFTTLLEGDLILVSVPSRKIEIQVHQIPCGNHATCNCAVIAREDNNIIGINVCSGSVSYIRYLTDTNNPGGYIYQKPNGYITIVLPSGTLIDAHWVASTVIDVYVTLYMNPTDSGTGLCFHNPAVNDPFWNCGSYCESYRVSGSNSFYNIRPVPSAGPLCLTDAILVPQCDCSTATCSLPAGVALYNYGQTCNAPLINKRKRQAASEPTTTQNPPSDGDNSGPLNLVWPTPKNNITEKQATDACNNALTKSNLYDQCVNRLKLDVSFIIQFCLFDIQALDDLNSPLPAVTSFLEIQCNLIIDALNSTDSTKNSSRQFYDNNVCPGQCSSQGSCVNGACQCNSGFVGSDCSVGNGQPPQIRGLVSSVCDIRSDSDGCKYVYVQASGFSNKVSCQINDTSGKLILIDYSPDVYPNLVKCHLPMLPVTLDVNRDFKQCSYTVLITIGNNQTYSNNWQNFTVFDSKNTTCTSNGCKPNDGVKCCSERNLATVSLLVLGYFFGKYALRFALQ